MRWLPSPFSAGKPGADRKDPMKYSKIVPLSLMAIGAALSAWGVFGKLVSVPVVGSIRFTESHFGGPGLAWTITALLLAAAGGCACPGRGQKPGWFCFGLALGFDLQFLAGHLPRNHGPSAADRHRRGNSSVARGNGIQRGLIALGVGFLLSTCGLIWNFWSSDR